MTKRRNRSPYQRPAGGLRTAVRRAAARDPTKNVSACTTARIAPALPTIRTQRRLSGTADGLYAALSPESLHVQLLQLRVGASEVAARRGDVAMAGQTLRGRDIHLRGPSRDRGVPQPVRRHALAPARTLGGPRDDRLSHLHAHPG